MPRPKGSKTRRPLSAETRRKLSEAASRAWAEGRGNMPPHGPRVAPPDATEDVRAPAREAIGTTSPRGISVQVRRDAKVVIAFGLVSADKGAAYASKVWAAQAPESRTGFWVPDDQLSKDETTQLVEAIYGELESYPKVVRAIAEMAQAGKHAALAYVASMIALPRLLRHGIIKPDDPIVSMLMFAGMAFEQQAAAASVPVEPGPTPEPDRGNGNGQIDVGGSLVEMPPVGSDFQVQTG